MGDIRMICLRRHRRAFHDMVDAYQLYMHKKGMDDGKMDKKM